MSLREKLVDFDIPSLFCFVLRTNNTKLSVLPCFNNNIPVPIVEPDVFQFFVIFLRTGLKSTYALGRGYLLRV